MPTEIVVGPDECRLARQGEVLVARHLTSDWTVAIHHPAAQVGVLARFPGQPDLAVRQAVHAARSVARSFAGAPHGWLAYVIGGAIAPGDDPAARLAHGCRLAIQASLWREGVLVKGEDAGGRHARSLYFDPAAGRLIVRSAGTLAPAAGLTAQPNDQPNDQPTDQPIALPCPLAS
jgi:hypothetical protein